MAYILIVEDDEDFAMTTAKVMETAGHEVRIELDTERGMTSMGKRRPDLVVLDVMFPEDSAAGFELARAMSQAKEKLGNIPVLMLTAVNAKFPLGFGSGDIDDNWLPVSDFLEKPVDFDVLKSKVGSLLKKASARAD